MSYSSPSKRALAQLHSLCHAGLSAHVFIPALLEALHGLIPSQRNLFDWTDDEGQLLHYFVEGPVDVAVARLYFEQFHNRDEADCMPRFDSLRDARAGVRSAREHATPAFYNSALYHEVWRPQGLHTRIEGVVRNGRGRLLGSLVLYRGPADPIHTAAEERTLAALLPAVARGLEAGAAAEPAHEGPFVPGPGCVETLLLDSQGQLQHASAGAVRLMLLADGGLSPSALAQSTEERARRMFGRLVDRLHAHAHENMAAIPPPAPSLTLITGYGRFTAQAQRLWSAGGSLNARPGLVQVTLRQHEPQAVAVQRVLRELPLTAGQAAVCAQLHSGHSHRRIAQQLRVAPSTVVDHVRKSLRALELTDSAELRSFIERRVAAVAAF